MNTKEFEFRGDKYEVNLDAARSVRVQRDISCMGKPESVVKGWDSYNMLFCGRLDEYLDRIPSENGVVGEFGCESDDFNAFVFAAAEAANAKN